MTRTLTLLACMLFCIVTLETFAQSYRLVGYRRNAFNNNVWTPDDSMTLSYSNGRGGDYNDFYYNHSKEDTLRHYDWNGSTCFLNAKAIKLYNSQNVNTEVYVVDGVGTNSSHIVHNLDGNNNDTMSISQGWVNNGWQNSSKNIKNFDINNNMLSVVSHLWNNANSVWDPMYKNLYTYDVNNNMTSDLSLHFNGSTWDSMSLSSYHYTNNLRDTLYRKQYFGNTEEKSAHVYQNGLKIRSYYYSLNGGTWGNGYQYFYFYQGTNNIYMGDSAHKWDAGTNAWKDDRREIYTIDNNGDAVSIVYILANSQTGLMENSWKDTMVYNSGHKAIWSMGLDWDGSAGAFVPGGFSTEEHYYYEPFTNDVRTLSLNTLKIEVYPSPAKDHITLRADFETPEDFRVQLYDMQGRLILQQGEKAAKEYTKNIPLDNLASGNYILQIVGSKTKAQEQFTIIK